MKVYTVHEQPHPDAVRLDRIDRAQSLQFVPDGFSLEAALFAPITLLAHKLYEGLALYAIALLAIISVLGSLGVSHIGIALAIAALHLITGFEFGELERIHLTSRGWLDLGIVSGASLKECERRFFDEWLPNQPIITTQLNPNTATPPDQSPAASDPARLEAMTSPSNPSSPSDSLSHSWLSSLISWRPGAR